MAQAAIALIEDGETLILDAGSMVAAFGQLLRRRRLRIITNTLALLPFLAEGSELELIVRGGGFRTTSMSTVGPRAVPTSDIWAAPREYPTLTQRGPITWAAAMS